MPRTSPLLHFVAPEELIKRLDDFRYEQRFPSRAAAIKFLLEWALTMGASDSAQPPKRDRR